MKWHRPASAWRYAGASMALWTGWRCLRAVSRGRTSGSTPVAAATPRREPADTSTRSRGAIGCASPVTAPGAAAAAGRSSTRTPTASRWTRVHCAAPEGEPLEWAEALEVTATQFVVLGWDDEAAMTLGVSGALRARGGEVL